jgi:hypothetical protein
VQGSNHVHDGQLKVNAMPKGDSRGRAAVGHGSKSALEELNRRGRAKPKPAQVRVVHKRSDGAAGQEQRDEGARQAGPRSGRGPG